MRWLLVVSLLILGGCEKKTQTTTVPDLPNTVEAENARVAVPPISKSEPKGIELVDLKVSLSPKIKGALRYLFHFDWIARSHDNSFEVYQLEDGEVIAAVVLFRPPNDVPSQYDSPRYTLEWGHLYDWEVRLSTDESLDLFMSAKQREARKLAPLVHTFKVDLRN